MQVYITKIDSIQNARKTVSKLFITFQNSKLGNSAYFYGFMFKALDFFRSFLKIQIWINIIASTISLHLLAKLLVYLWMKLATRLIILLQKCVLANKSNKHYPHHTCLTYDMSYSQLTTPWRYIYKDAYS